MIYEVDFKPKAMKDLDNLPPDIARRIVEKIDGLRNDLSGDVKRLTNFTPEYRLRIGDYRALFEVENGRVVVYRVRHRREVYR